MFVLNILLILLLLYIVLGLDQMLVFEVCTLVA